MKRLVAILCWLFAQSALGAVGIGAYSTNGSVAATNSLAFNKPTGVVNGDFELAAFGIILTTANTLSPWTLNANTNASSAIYVNNFSLFAGGSEPSSYTWTTIGNTTWSGILIRLTSVNTTTPISDNASNTGSLTAPNVANVASGDASIAVCAYYISAGVTGYTGISGGTNWVYQTQYTGGVTEAIALATNIVDTGTVTGPTFTTLDSPNKSNCQSFRIHKVAAPAAQGAFLLNFIAH